ncbi:MAG: 7TM-DISM domain-containing protein [Sphingomonas sp.]
MSIAHPAHAQAGVAGRSLGVCVLRDAPGMRAAELIRHPERFDCRTDQHAFGPGEYWVISQDIGDRTPAPRNARISSLWQDGLALHALYADGTTFSRSVDSRGTSRLIQLGAMVEFPIPAARAPLARLLWQVHGSPNMRGILMGARLASPQESADANLEMAAIYAAFGGLCIALLCYNLALWGALRHRFQLYYCAMVAGLLVYAFSSSGALAWVWRDLANNDRMRINYLMLGFTGAAALVFARSFFEERVFAGWLGRITGAVAAMLADRECCSSSPRRWRCGRSTRCSPPSSSGWRRWWCRRCGARGASAAITCGCSPSPGARRS